MWFISNSRPDEFNIKLKSRIELQNMTGTNNSCHKVCLSLLSQQFKSKLGSGTCDKLRPQLHDKDWHPHLS